MRTKSRLFVIAIAAAALFAMQPALSVFAAAPADPTRDVSLTVTCKTSDSPAIPEAGAEVTVYKVADAAPIDAGFVYSFTNEFSSLTFNVNGVLDDTMAGEAYALTVSDGISGTSQTTDADGIASFGILDKGLYLVAQTGSVSRFTDFDPFFVYLPSLDDSSNWVYDVTAYPKMTYTPPIDITVSKIWNDQSSATRPSSVTVELLMNGTACDTATLSASNNWTFTWTDKDAGEQWSVREVNVPSGYTATYSSSGFDFTITNTYKLPQTGQLNWPVPVMIFAGMLLVTAGIMVRTAGKKDE